MTKQRLIRHGQSQRTGTIIDSEVINKWIEKETGEDGVLKGYTKIEQEYAGSKDNATQGAFAVDDIENPTRYFVVDIQQLQNTEHRGEFACAVAGVEIDTNNNPIGPVDVHQEYGNAQHVRSECQIAINETRVYLVDAKSVTDIVNGNYNLWGAE